MINVSQDKETLDLDFHDSSAITTLNVLGVVPVYGITSALNTLSNQAHGGAATGGRRVDLNMLYSLRYGVVDWKIQ